MLVRSEYAHLIVGSKVGCGTQGATDVEQLARTVDRVLVLDSDLGTVVGHRDGQPLTYCSALGPRAWLRVMHDAGNWKDPIAWAMHCADQIQAVYGFGVRDLIIDNEQIALEGLGQSEEDYRWLNWWGVTCVTRLKQELASRGLIGVRIWGPAFSPGHDEDDGIVGYRLVADFLRVLDGIVGHYYWLKDGGGAVGKPGAEWWAQRIERAHHIVETEMGIPKPWAIGEFNRAVNRGDAADIVRYADESKVFYQWCNTLDYVVAAFAFLYTAADPQHYDMTWTQMPKMIQYMAEPWDRLAELGGTTPMPVLTIPASMPFDDLAARYGPGFARALTENKALVGDPLGERVDIATSQHVPAGTDPYRFSHLQTTRGTLLWRKSDNLMAFMATGGPIFEFTEYGLRST